MSRISERQTIMVRNNKGRTTAKAGSSKNTASANTRSKKVKQNCDQTEVTDLVAIEQIQILPKAKDIEKQSTKGKVVRQNNSNARKVIVKDKTTLNNNNAQIGVSKLVKPDDLSILLMAKDNPVCTVTSVKELERVVTPDFDSLDETADDIVVDVNADDDDFPSEDEEFEAENEGIDEDQTQNYDNQKQDNEETDQEINKQIGLHTKSDYCQPSNGNVFIMDCDSEVNFKLPVEHISHVSAAEMVEQMQTDNPALMMVMQHLVDKRFKQNETDAGPAHSPVGGGTAMASKHNGGNDNLGNVGVVQSDPPVNVQQTPQVTKPNANILIKSPSDMTIYAPGLKLAPHSSGIGAVNEQTPVNIIDQISIFVERIRVETVGTPPQAKVGRTGEAVEPMGQQQQQLKQQAEQQPQPSTSGAVAGQASLAKTHAEDLLIQAEQYRAAVQKPKGTLNYNHPQSNQILPFVQEQMEVGQQVNLINNPQGDNRISSVGMVSEDDEFFHLMCHVDASLTQKIQQGEFIELEKLFPQGRSISQ